MTLTEAAKLLNLSPVTLRVQIGRKKLHADKHGRDYWVTPAEVERYRAASKGKHQPKGPADE